VIACFIRSYLFQLLSCRKGKLRGSFLVQFPMKVNAIVFGPRVPNL
jgi:hypothetical protein